MRDLNNSEFTNSHEKNLFLKDSQVVSKPVFNDYDCLQLLESAAWLDASKQHLGLFLMQFVVRLYADTVS